MEAHLWQLPQRLLLLGAAALTVSALETADLVALCGQTWQGDGLLLRSHSASRRFYFVVPDTDCGLWLEAAAPGDRIRFQFRFFLVYSLTPASPPPPAPSPSADPCAPGSFLQFYEGPPGAPRVLGAPVCGLTIPVPVASSGPFLGLRLVTRGRQPRVDFVGEVTSFRLGSCGAYFRCGNGRCIPPSLVCDHWGMDNCGDGSDQSSWPPADCGGPSLVASQTASTDADTSKALTLSPPFGSAGPLWIATKRSPPAGRDPVQQNVTSEGRWLLVITPSYTCPSPGDGNGNSRPRLRPERTLSSCRPPSLGGGPGFLAAPGLHWPPCVFPLVLLSPRLVGLATAAGSL
ncbi:low-density lipoprotein receptor class A domain-containing protein 2 isoform X2 [Nycticebus coucang]|uniref:low-density lipoprotein receptor class A domain-containing protein 2 isoform X2 n=1 Tax=Nycticebus coucang TaxID=9470 RepID=UPI00234DBA1B|nr:low-density lipoprotein receptor class A domain-containing protein 2 isoform X2 [Nycticebus coucang]